MHISSYFAFQLLDYVLFKDHIIIIYFLLLRVKKFLLLNMYQLVPHRVQTDNCMV